MFGKYAFEIESITKRNAATSRITFLSHFCVDQSSAKISDPVLNEMTVVEELPYLIFVSCTDSGR